jgi:membrane-anchored protein YejM (alkaline phosphatase superfamily)
MADEVQLHLFQHAWLAHRDPSSKVVAWGHWFTCFNGFVATGWAYSYATNWGLPTDALGWLFLLCNTLSHFMFIAFGIYLATIFPISLLFPNSKLLRGYSALIASAAILLLWFDNKIFANYRIHLTPLSFDLQAADMDNFHGWLQFLLTFTAVLLLEFLIANALWKRMQLLQQKRWGFKIASLLLSAFFATHLLHVWADANQYSSITKQDQMYPMSYPATARTIMADYGLPLQPRSQVLTAIQYPLTPLNYQSTTARPLLVITVAHWNPSLIDETTMPFYTAYQARSQVFTQHHTGNSQSTAALFTLLYGLQNSYQQAMLDNTRSPLLAERLQQLGYNSAQFQADTESNQSLLTWMPPPPPTTLSNDNLAAADRSISQQFLNWQTQQTQPWFALIQLTGLTNFDDIEPNRSLPSAQFPAHYSSTKRVLIRQYRRALHSLDTRLRELISPLPVDTLVVITGLQGRSFAVNHPNVAQNFAPAMIQVPLTLFDANRPPKVYTQTTHHSGIMPTLMQHYLGCNTPISDYSTGNDLFAQNAPAWFFMGESKHFAIYTGDQIAVIEHGHYQVYNAKFQPLDDKISAQAILSVMAASNKFLKN